MTQAAPLMPSPETDSRMLDYLELLAVIGNDFAASLDLDATLLMALNNITRFLDAEAASVFLLENDESELVCRMCVGSVDITGIRLAAGDGIIGQSMAEKRCLIVRDVRKDTRFNASVDEETGFVTRSILCAPMRNKDGQVGAMELINKRGGDGLFDEQDRQFLQALASSAAMAFNNARMAQTVMDQERINRELDLAAEMQRALLPTRRPAPFPVNGVSLPARTVSGDFFDFFPLGDGRICFNLGDVAGKGINAAMMMAKTSSLYRCLGKNIDQPGRLLGLINREICETATRGMFVTIVGGIFDPRTGSIRMANAGHEPPILLRPDGRTSTYAAEAPPLGITPDIYPDARFPEIDIQLGDGTLYIFSDGITEGRVIGNTMLGVEGLLRLIAENSDLAAAQRLDAIVDRFRDTGRPLHDDLTLLSIEQGGDLKV